MDICTLPVYGSGMQQNREGNETEAGRLARVLIELDSRELSALNCENQADVAARRSHVVALAEDAEIEAGRL